MHVPRRPYVQALPGLPTITPGEDFLVASTGDEMKRQLRRVLEDRDLARELAARGRRTILARHTCGHRVDQLLAIHAQLDGNVRRE